MDCRQCQATQQASVKQSSLRVALLSSKQANMHVDQWWTIGVDLTSQCFQVEEQSLASSTSWAISEPSSWTSHTGSQLLQQSQAVHTRDIFLEAWCGPSAADLSKRSRFWPGTPGSGNPPLRNLRLGDDICDAFHGHHIHRFRRGHCSVFSDYV